jgi:hypothetical protein
MSAAVKEKQPFHVEIINYNREGTPYWVAIGAIPVKKRKVNLKLRG